jgi:O-antigen/teichoic acid export membrane protein
VKVGGGGQVPDFDPNCNQDQPLTEPSPQRAPEGLRRDFEEARTRDLEKTFVKGVAWTAAVKWTTQLLTWGTTIVVARLLLPTDYGLVGMATIYINLFTLFSEFGIGTAVVTMQDLSENQISQLNTLSVLLGFIGFAMSGAAAIPLGKFFRAPNLPMVVTVLSWGFLVSGIRTVPYSLLQKQLRFKLLAVIEGLQGVVQALVTLLLAFLGFRYWALVLGILSFSITPTVLTLIWSRHSFAFPRSSSIRRAVHYSRHIVIGRLCWASFNDSDFVIAGRTLGAGPMGAYTLAWTLAHGPIEKLSNLVNRLTPSVFARIQQDPSALRRYLQNITGGMALLIFPLTIGIALVAPEFVALVLKSKWNGIILPLNLLVLHALVRSNVILLEPLLNAIGEERLWMRVSMVAMVVLPVTFYIGSYWGTVGIAAGWILVYPLTQVPLFLRVFRRLNLSPSDYFATLRPALTGSVAMFICVETFKALPRSRLPLYAFFISEVVVGILAYVLAMMLMHRDYLQGILNFMRGITSGDPSRVAS